MILVLCDGDGCNVTIDRDNGGWFGVDYQAPPIEAEPDESGTVYFSEVIGLNQDHEFHFHSVDCLVSWAMTRAFTPQPEGTTT